jgi:hypothetical protein
MDGKDEPPREQAWAGLCAYPCPSWTPRINGEQNKKKDEVNGVAHWGGWRMGIVPLVSVQVGILSYLNSDRGG